MYRYANIHDTCLHKGSININVKQSVSTCLHIDTRMNMSINMNIKKCASSQATNKELSNKPTNE